MSIRITRRAHWWPNGVVPFEIDTTDFPPGSTAHTEITGAINHWNTNTQFQFVAHNGERSFLVFTEELGVCHTPIGLQGTGRQTVGCDVASADFGTGSIIHEIGHAVGLWHEHTREDRETFVDIQGKRGRYPF